MKINVQLILSSIVLGGVLIIGAGRTIADEATAFELIKEGNKHVGEDAKDRVVQIRSEKSIGSLVPNVWYVVYYDPDASLKATEVKFGGGKKLGVKRPGRLLEPVTGSHRQISRERMKLDSDKAIDIATKDPLLKNVKLTNTQLWLERGDDAPQWKVRLWAERIRNPGRTAEIGDVIISAEDGKVLERNLHINRID